MTPESAASLSSDRPDLPWWRHQMLWLVIAGPVIVVVASFVTLGAAIYWPDPVLSHEDVESVATTPAMQARNHAAAPPVRTQHSP